MAKIMDKIIKKSCKALALATILSLNAHAMNENNIQETTDHYGENDFRREIQEVSMLEELTPTERRAQFSITGKKWLDQYLFYQPFFIMPLESLLNLGADVNAQNESGITVLEQSIVHENLYAVQLLIERGAHISDRMSARINLLQLNNALVEAAQKGDTDTVHSALAAGADVNFDGHSKETALKCAINTGNSEIVTMLLNAGAHINTSPYEYSNCLSNAIFNKHKEIAYILIIEGANLGISKKTFDEWLSIQTAPDQDKRDYSTAQKACDELGKQNWLREELLTHKNLILVVPIPGLPELIVDYAHFDATFLGEETLSKLIQQEIERRQQKRHLI